MVASSAEGPVDRSLLTRVSVGAVELAHPVMTASGTAGHGAELGAYVDLSRLGAVVVKSISPEPWAGNPAPRVHATPAGMINAVGLQGPGVEAWCREDLPALAAAGASVVVSIWGRSVDEYRRAARMLDANLRDHPEVVAVEVNLSCPNLEGRRGIFAHDERLSAEVIGACRESLGDGRPIWAKLSPNTDRLIEVARSVVGVGAAAVTLVNTALGMVLDRRTLRPVLGNGGGGLSGRAVHPIAVRAVYDVRVACPDVAIVGVGGVASGWDAAELMLAGASAVQVGTATFADPRAVEKISRELEDWASEQGFSALSQITNGAHTR